MSRTLIRNGTVFDGTNRPPIDADVLVDDDGTVAEIRPGIEAPADVEIIDAAGCWVTPGFIDNHTHYDAELEVAPELSESLRHGITTALIGSCGLSMVVGEPEDMADMFCRVEGIPRDVVLPILNDIVDWSRPGDYVSHLASLPLGPNIVGMVGHSTIRAEVMGLGRSSEGGVTPTEDELVRMERLVDESVEAGLLGLSANLLPWDKMGGTRFRSRPTPSVFAKLSEYRRLADVTRRHDAVFQAIPNVQTRWTIAPLMDFSRPRGGVPLRVSLLTMVDAPPAPGVYKAIGAAGNFYNRRLGARVRFQALPTPFDLYTDGLENPVIEEFGAGTEALHLEDLDARRTLLEAPVYRQRFRKQWSNKLAARAFHRDLDQAWIVDCPDHALAGRSFAEVAADRGVDPIDAFIDLQIAYGNDLRWYSVVANDNPAAVEWIMAHPVAMPGFSDAGAHLRNMGFYNFPLRMLKRVRDAELEGRPYMTLHEAVHKLTGDIADFYQIDAGHLAVGKRADVVVIDPLYLDDSVEDITEAPFVGVEGLNRLVRRNDDTVRAVLVNGRVAWTDAGPADDLGTSHGYGTFLPFRGASSAKGPDRVLV